MTQNNQSLSEAATTGARFRNANGVLAFLGTTWSTGTFENLTMRRHAIQGWWWIEITVDHEQLTSLIWAAGGRPFVKHGKQWAVVPLSGEMPLPEESTETIEISNWPEVGVPQLLVNVPLHPSRYTEASLLDIITPSSLGRWVLRRAINVGLQVTLFPSQQRPLDQSDPQREVLRLRIQAPANHRIPAALVQGFTQLPYTLVGIPWEGHKGTLLVDVRYTLPLPPVMIRNLVPVEEIWVLGGAGIGTWHIQTIGAAISGDSLLDAPDLPILSVPNIPQTSSSQHLPVRLVHRPSRHQRVDAVLLDDQELEWLRRFLMGRPLGEQTFLILGPGRHLITAPGGLAQSVPFGIPLVWIGPGGLYRELGTDFAPPLPESARHHCFRLDEASTVVVIRNAAYRFPIQQLVPAWTLWVGAPPTIQTGLSEVGEQLLTRLSSELRKTEAQQAPLSPSETKPLNRSKRVRLLERAQKAELSGDLIRAAELLEQAGYPGQAGRLYERAAQDAG